MFEDFYSAQCDKDGYRGKGVMKTCGGEEGGITFYGAEEEKAGRALKEKAPKAENEKADKAAEEKAEKEKADKAAKEKADTDKE